MGRAIVGALLVVLAPSCGKVPLYDIEPQFFLSQATWFDDEDTLFVFYEVTAEQGLSDASAIELSWASDNERVDWTPVSALDMVHTHLLVDCGEDTLCGSASVHVDSEPRRVGVRMRYHPDGDLADESDPIVNVVVPGQPHHRSLVVYGVFDETNTHVQWRSRHQFPALRNEEVEALGLRRSFLIDDQSHGTEDDLVPRDNPYGYGVDCPPDFGEMDLSQTGTFERAVFHPEELPIEAEASATVCAEATVTDANGTFTTTAIARKNPEVRPAFPVLRSPVYEAEPVPFFLGPCERTISDPHEDMQRQRLQLQGVKTTCTDDWQRPEFVDDLVRAFRETIEAQRVYGDDMVLVIAIHQDDAAVSAKVEEALAAVVLPERHKSSPRVAGAFVLDSTSRGLGLAELEPVTLWCPSTLSDPSSGVAAPCATPPTDSLDLELGPISLGALPILPGREEFLDFIDAYGEDQAGSVQSLSFRTPEFSTTADHQDIGDYGVATFLDDELIDTHPEHSFSYCADSTAQIVVFRSDLTLTYQISEETCRESGLDPDLCVLIEYGMLPLEFLPQWHHMLGEDQYELGLLWEFPFLLQMQYQLVQAGSVSVVGLSVPFGVATSAEAYYGSVVWSQEQFDLEEALTQCTRWCDHPTFDGAGVYQVQDLFELAYQSTCYTPDFPAPGDDGFPRDP